MYVESTLKTNSKLLFLDKYFFKAKKYKLIYFSSFKLFLTNTTKYIKCKHKIEIYL